jgi:histidinol-phosphate aminotransferase
MSSSTATSTKVTLAALASSVIVCAFLLRRSSSKSTASDSEKTVAERLARSNILALAPYRCARDDYDSGVLLDANENSHGPTLTDAASVAHLSLERYPSPYQVELKTLFSNARGCKPENVFVGVGSDEAIDLLFRIFCAPAVDNVITSPPTYGMYKVCATVNDVAIKEVPLTPGFDVRVDAMVSAADSRTKMMFVCSPGNPTSKSIPLADIVALATSRFRGLVIVDEAYIDFSTVPSAVPLIEKYPNIVVLQTLSKAFGLAGIRCGFAVAHPSVIQLMNNVKAPYNISSLTSEKAVQALQSLPVLRRNIKTILDERERVRGVLKSRAYVVRVCESDANFILFELKSKAQAVYKTMADTHGVVSRYRGSEKWCNECIRVTVGTRVENEKFLDALDKAYVKVNGDLS